MENGIRCMERLGFGKLSQPEEARPLLRQAIPTGGCANDFAQPLIVGHGYNHDRLDRGTTAIKPKRRSRAERSNAKLLVQPPVGIARRN
jgi:hypothetical protein